MELLKELILLITPNKLKKINLLSDMSDNAMLRQLYMGYHENRWETDNDAAIELYGKNYKIDTFYKLRHDLTKKLIQIFPLINITEDDRDLKRRKALWECGTAYHTGIFLLYFTPAGETGRTLIEKVFPKCLEFEFTDLIIPIATTLSARYKMIKPNREKAKYYEQIAIDYSLIYVVETKGNLYLTEMYGYYIKDKSVKEFVPIKALEYMEDLAKHPISKPTQKTVFYTRMLEVIHHMAKYDYRKTIEACDAALSFFENQVFLDRSNVRSFYLQAITSHAYCREFEQGYIKANKALALIDEGTFGWFKLKELFLQLALYSKRYQEAYRILRTTVKHDRYEELPEHIKQWWLLQEGFIFVLKEMNLVRLGEGEELKMRYQSFVNKLSVWSSDKRGLNFSIRILHLFYLIVKNNDKSQDIFIDRIEPLRTYVSRYAKTEEMQRSKWIVDIMDGIAKHGFSAKKIHKDAIVQKAYKSLCEEPYDITDPNRDIEPIPFQDVYEYIDLILTSGVPPPLPEEDFIEI